MNMADYSRGYEGERYGRRYEEDDERYGGGSRRRRREDRGFLERAGDELRSWFGDEEAERRRTRDERDYERGYGEYGRGYSGYGREGYGREGHRQGSRGDYERGYDAYGRSGYGREGYYGGYGQRDYGHAGSQESGRGGRYGASRYGGESGYGERGSEYSSGYGSEYGYGQSYGSPYWSYTEMWMIPGPYTGRGPSGYRRSDDRVTEDICERLQQHGQVDASYITVNVNNGEVTLTGTVDSRLEKRLAEDVAESCSGVREVHNNLRVKGREQEQQGQYGQQTGASQTQPSTQYGSQTEPRSRYTTG